MLCSCYPGYHSITRSLISTFCLFDNQDGTCIYIYVRQKIVIVQTYCNFIFILFILPHLLLCWLYIILYILLNTYFVYFTSCLFVFILLLLDYIYFVYIVYYRIFTIRIIIIIIIKILKHYYTYIIYI